MTFRVEHYFSSRGAFGLAVLAIAAAPSWAHEPYTAGVVYERIYVDYEVERDGTYVRTAEFVKRFETRQGIEREGKAQLAFQSGREEAEFIDARVLQPDGRETVLKPDAVHLQESYPFPEAAVFTDRKRKTLVFPDLQPGSRALSTSRMRQRDPEFAGRFSALEWRSAHFGAPDTRIRFTLPADMPLQIDAHQAEVTQQADGDRVTWTVHMRVNAPWPPEPGSVAAVDYSPRVAVSTFPDYPSFAADYRAMIAGRDAVTPEIQALADSLTQGVDAPREQVRSLYEWVAENIRYVAIHVGRGGWVPHAAGEVLERRYGDCKDHVTLLSALLKAKGIDSSPVLLNAGNSHWLPRHPTQASFNHMIVYLPALDLYLDSTVRYADFGLLPLESADKPALIIADGRVVRTPALRAADNRTAMILQLALDAGGRLKGDTMARAMGLSAQIDRMMMVAASSVPDAQFASAILANAGEHGQGQFRRPASLALGEPVESGMSYQLSRTLDVSRQGQLAVASGVRFGGIQHYGKGVLGTPRRAPFLCPAITMSETQHIDLPATLDITVLPTGRQLTSDDPIFPYAFTTTYEQQPNGRVEIRRQLVIDTPSARCGPEQHRAQMALAREIALEYDGMLSFAPR